MSQANTSKNICIIQLTRIGDILQTYQSCLTVKNDYPDARLILVARKEFAEQLSFLLKDVFYKIFLFDSKSILGEKDSLENSQKEINKLLAQIKSESIDVVVNLSFSKTSAYLSTLIDARYKLGMTCNDNGEIAISDKWSQYVYSTVMTGPLNPFSLVDIFRNIIGAGPLTPHSPSTKHSNVIVLHPFSSLAKKTWKIDKWGEIIFKLLKNNPNLSIKIVGSKSEKSESEKLFNSPLLQNFKNRIDNLTGTTNLEALYNIVSKSALFIGHDSMVGHLASVANIQSLTISLGTVRPIETVPWGTDNYVISPKTQCYPCFPQDKCETMKCHSDIPYQVVLSAIESLLADKKISSDKLMKTVTCFHLDGALIQKTYIAKSGFIGLKNITEPRNDIRELMHTFYRINWLFNFVEKEEQINFPKINSSTTDKLLTYLKGIEHIYELTSFGKKYSGYILSELSKDSPNVTSIKEYSHKIDEIDGLMEIIKNNYQALEPLVNFYKIARFNLSGENVVELTENSYLLYEEQANSCGVIFELIEKTIAEYRHQNEKAAGDYKSY